MPSRNSSTPGYWTQHRHKACFSKRPALTVGGTQADDNDVGVKLKMAHSKAKIYLFLKKMGNFINAELCPVQAPKD
jgi:hypothetical protein